MDKVDIEELEYAFSVLKGAHEYLYAQALTTVSDSLLDALGIIHKCLKELDLT